MRYSVNVKNDGEREKARMVPVLLSPPQQQQHSPVFRPGERQALIISNTCTAASKGGVIASCISVSDKQVLN